MKGIYLVKIVFYCLNSDLKEAINDLLDGKELVVKTDPLNNWQLVEEEETLLNESIQSQDEKVTIFDLTGLKVELDDDYFFDENEGENNFEDDSSSLATTDYQTEQEVDPMAWHPVVKKDYQSYQGIYNSYTYHLKFIYSGDGPLDLDFKF